MSSFPIWFFLVSVGSVAALYAIFKKSEHFSLTQKTSLDLGLWMIIGALIGGRALHVLYEEPDYYLQNPIEILSLWKGGFVFYGGLLGSILAAWVACWKIHLPFFIWADFVTPIISVYYAFGRLACFANGCCYGHQTDLILAWHGRHPTQLYAMILELVTLLILRQIHRVSILKNTIQPGDFFWSWLLFHSLGRIWIETLRDDPRGPLLLNQSLSSTLSICLILISLIGILNLRRKTFKQLK